MAAMVNDEVTQIEQNNIVNPSVVILDSDEEQEQTTRDLFEGFVKALQPFLERKEVLLLRVKFAEIRNDYASSSTFRDMLRRKANQIRNTDAYIHFNEVLKDLIKNAALYGRNATIYNRDTRSVAENTSDAVTNSNPSMAGKFESHQHNRHQTPSSIQSTSIQSTEPLEVIDLDDQSSSLGFIPTKSLTHKHLSQEDRERIINKKNRKRKIRKLEFKLRYISKEIKRLSRAELSLEEMDLADSNYIRESKLKKIFNNTWEKICQLKGRPPNTGRVIEKEVEVKGTRFPAIDRAVQKFLKKKKGFPNIFDIRNIVIRANKKHNLKLTPGVLQEIAADVFTDIGNELQKKRKKDYEYNFGCHLTDNCLLSLDPALNDNSLRRKLEENKKVSQNAMESIFEKYVHLGRVKDQERSDSPSSSNYDDNSSDDDSRRRKKPKKLKSKKRPSPYSSDDEWRKLKNGESPTAAVCKKQPSASPSVLSNKLEQGEPQKRLTPSSSDDESRKLRKSKHEECSTITSFYDKETSVSHDLSSSLPSTSNINIPSSSEHYAPILSARPLQSGDKTKSKCIEIIIDDDNDNDCTQNIDSHSVEKESKPQNEVPIANNNGSLNVDNDQSSRSSLTTGSLNVDIEQFASPLPNGHPEPVNLESQSSSSLKKSIIFKESNIVQDDCTKTEDNVEQRTQNTDVKLQIEKPSIKTLPERSSPFFPSSKKLNISASKLHLKIQQLREKKLSGLISGNSDTKSLNVSSNEYSYSSPIVSESAQNMEKSTIGDITQAPTETTAVSTTSLYQVSTITSSFVSNSNSVTLTASDTHATLSNPGLSRARQLSNGHTSVLGSNIYSDKVRSSDIGTSSPLRNKLVVSVNKMPLNSQSTKQLNFSPGSKGHHDRTNTKPVKMYDNGSINSTSTNNSLLRNGREKRSMRNASNQRVNSQISQAATNGLVHRMKQAVQNQEKVTSDRLYQALSKVSSPSQCTARAVIVLSDDDDD